ncbi:transposase [Candidatus Gottesmanbacteria bacterium]|nr:transposase [Candidatus Gottesmanbacteria bacterium]
MPGRNIPLVTGEIYHVFNRGLASVPVFQNKRDYDRILETMLYYQNERPPIKYSRFLTLSIEDRQNILKNLAKQRQFQIEIITYCLMPTHFHLMIKQVVNEGISKFVGNFTNSYTRYLNTRSERIGPLFEGKFKAVRIHTEGQLLHLHRYIHLNPYSSFVVKGLNDLENYIFSSLPEYLGNTQTNHCAKNAILDNFKNKDSYKKFLFDQADYQRRLEEIKHLTME